MPKTLRPAFVGNTLSLREKITLALALLPLAMMAVPIYALFLLKQSAVEYSLYGLIVLFMALSALVAAGVVVLVRLNNASRAKALAEIASAAEAIAATGRPTKRLLSGQNNEFSRLSLAFNTMIDRLTESYAELEQRVTERTEMLQQRELYLQATLDNLPFFFWLKDADSRFLAVNKVFAEACGHANPDEIIGLNDFDVWPADLAQRYRTDDQAIMAGRQEKSVEEPVAGGSESGWIETYKKAVLDRDGSILGTVGFARDISQRKKILEALTESEHRWQRALSGANDGLWDWNPPTGEVYFSDRWKTMLGYDVAEIGHSVTEWTTRIHPDDLEKTMAEVQRHLRGATDFYQAEHRVRCKNGEYKWILARGKAQLDANGEAVRMTGSHTDITERRADEISVKEHAEQLNAIFALSPDGIVSFDAAHCVKYISPAFSKLTGLEAATLIGLNETEISNKLAQQCLPQARFTGVAALRLLQKIDDTGHHRQKIAIAGAGKRVLEVGFREASADSVSQILYLRDVTHESEVDRMKSEFLSTAAHELRTPMASIYGFAELLLAQKFSAQEQKELLATIFKQSELMVSIINELLDLARIEARRGKDFNLRAINLNTLVEQTIAGYKTPANRDRIRFEKLHLPLTVRGDENKLTQALHNVISNAFKYSPQGGEIRMQMILPEPSHETAQLPDQATIGCRIIDHGIGMTAEQRARVFERFYRADTSGKISGTGLGMSIVQEIIELHGGKVTVESQFNQGTTVTIWLPLAKQPNSDSAE